MSINTCSIYCKLVDVHNWSGTEVGWPISPFNISSMDVYYYTSHYYCYYAPTMYCPRYPPWAKDGDLTSMKPIASPLEQILRSIRTVHFHPIMCKYWSNPPNRGIFFFEIKSPPFASRGNTLISALILLITPSATHVQFPTICNYHDSGMLEETGCIHLWCHTVHWSIQIYKYVFDTGLLKLHLTHLSQNNNHNEHSHYKESLNTLKFKLGDVNVRVERFMYVALSLSAMPWLLHRPMTSFIHMCSGSIISWGGKQHLRTDQ